MTSPLLQLADQARQLDDILANVENPEAPEAQALIKQLLDLTAEKERKVDAYCGLIRELELRANARQEESDRLRQRAVVSKNLADELRARLLQALRLQGIKKVETEHFTVTRAANGGKVPVVVPDENAVPPGYTELTQTIKVNKDKIREALEAGQALPFATLGERGESVRIK